MKFSIIKKIHIVVEALAIQCMWRNSMVNTNNENSVLIILGTVEPFQ